MSTDVRDGWAVRISRNGHAKPSIIASLHGYDDTVVRGDPADPRDKPQLVSALHKRCPSINTKEWEGALEREALAQLDVDDTTPAGARWPAALAPAAFHGLAGEFVRAVSPATEADPAALLFQFLAMAGSLIGRGPYVQVGPDRHFANIFVGLVGETSKARKGTSWSWVRQLAYDVDPMVVRRITAGLSSGEGLIMEVRDPIDNKDAGTSDKRLLVHEPELTSALAAMSRQGNTLSQVIRAAWDTGELRVLTKNTPLRATGAHISIVGHATRDELLHTLTRTEAANGFGNRFLWPAARRSKFLPDPNDIDDPPLAPLVENLHSVLKFCGTIKNVQRDDTARGLWDTEYPSLSEGKPGLLGAMIARAEAQVVRLSLLYALLDQSGVVGDRHLLAALAAWNYCETSARYVFGEAFGDPVTDELLQALRAAGGEGLSRTAIRDHFGRNKGKDHLDRALQMLEGAGAVRRGKRPTGGRDAEWWVIKVYD